MKIYPKKHIKVMVYVSLYDLSLVVFFGGGMEDTLQFYSSGVINCISLKYGVAFIH